MAVNIHANAPTQLLEEILSAIEAGRVPGWDAAGSVISPTNPKLAGRARFHCSCSVSSLMMGIEVLDLSVPTDALTAVLEGRMVQMLRTHFRDRFSIATVSGNTDNRVHAGLR